MGFRDFCALTPGELTLAAAQFAEERTRAHQGEWERTRTLAAITVQPHVKGRVSARSLLPLPWDKEAANPNRPAAPTLSKEQSLERLKGLLARQGAESQRPDGATPHSPGQRHERADTPGHPRTMPFAP